MASLLDLPKVAHPDFAFPRRKPVGQVEVDWNNPITAGLQICIVPQGHSYTDLVTKSGSRMVVAGGTFGGGELHMNNASVHTVPIRPVSAYHMSAMYLGRADAHTSWDSYGGMITIPADSGSTACWSLQRNAATDGLQIYMSGSPTTVATKPSDMSSLTNLVFTKGISTSATLEYRNGKYIGSSTSNISVTSSDPKIHINGERAGSASNAGSTHFSAFCFWSRQLSAEEVRSLYRDPYQVLKPALGNLKFVWGLGSGSATVAPNDLTQGQTLDAVTLTQHNVLAVDALAQGQTIDNLTLTQANVLSVAALDQAQTIDNITLTQHNIIAPAALLQGQTIDNLTLTQANVLSVDALTQAQTIDALTLVQHGILSPDALIQGQTIDNLALTIAGSLAIQAVAQGQTIDGLTLTQHNIIAPADLTQAQILDATALVQHYQLAVESLLQSHLLDATTVTPTGSSLTIADMTQAQLLDAIGLTEYAILSVNDLTQAQLLDAITLGGLVIGELQGTIVMYALIGGEIQTYTLLDGDITFH